MVSSAGSSSTRVVQITNIAPQATKDQMQTLFGFLGKIDDIRLYPTVRDVSMPVASRICYVRYYDSATAMVAQHMTNTVFIDRALIVIPVSSGEIPDEHKALEMSANGTLVPGLTAPDPRLPAHVVNSLEGGPPNQILQTHDPKLGAAGLPPYPPLPATYEARVVEEARRSILLMDIPESLTTERLIEHFSQAGEVKYMRFCNREADRLVGYALIEFTEQESVIKGLQLHGSTLDGHLIKVHHSTQAINKPQAKSNEAAQREIEEAMCRVKEAQNLISAAIDPVIGLLSKDKRRTRSRSRSRRRSRSRSRRRSRSRHRSRRSRSRHRSKRSRSRHRHRTRSRSGHRSSRSKRSRSRSRHRSSRSKRDHSRDKKEHRSKEKSKTPAADVEKPPVEEPVKVTPEAEKPPEEPAKEVESKRSRSRDRKVRRSKSRSPARVARKRSRSRDRKRSKSRERKRSRSRERKRTRSRDRKRSRTPARKRSRSRDRRSRDRKRSRSRSKRSLSRGRRSRSGSKTVKAADKSRKKSPNLPAVTEERGHSPSRSPPPPPLPPDNNSPDKSSPDNMDISNSP